MSQGISRNTFNSRRNFIFTKMNCPRLATLSLIAGVSVMFFLGCEENFSTKNEGSTLSGTKTFRGGSEGPGSFTDHPNGDRYPYPEIIFHEYISDIKLFAHTKCLAWRITWPDYAGDADTDKIPSVFNTSNGALNSFYYLNNVSPQTTYNSKFSLFSNDKVECSMTLWDELDYAFDAPSGSMEIVQFAKVDQPLNIIMDWVTKRASQFENYWPGSDGEELDYNEGDFILYYLNDQDYYGGIRIVSMSPRIIEVYLAVPNL